MALYEVAVVIKNGPDTHTSIIGKRQGDIVAVKPYPWNWGRKEIDEYLIVIFETTRSVEQVYKTEESVYLYTKNDSLISQAEANALEALNDMRFKLVYKNRFSIPLAKVLDHITDLDLDKVENKLWIYQPFKKASQLVDKFDGKNKNRLLSLLDVDTYSIAADIEQEFVINLDLYPIIWDKLREQWI